MFARKAFIGKMLARKKFSSCRVFTCLWLLILVTMPALAQAPQATGTISGSVVDSSGSTVAGANVRLSSEASPTPQNVLSASDGQFSFTNVPPGPFQITITFASFTPQTLSGTLHPGENFSFPPTTLVLATAVTEVQVSLSRADEAQAQLKDQEKQRVLGVIPNFYVSYVPDAVPLVPKQKFQLAWRYSIDPVTFAITGAVAGIAQATDQFNGYGQGAQGYANRYAAAYGDQLIGTFIGDAILPSLLKQDPRYFYKGTGSKRSRILYALAASVICKGDNGKWQPAYSAIGGSLAAGGISYLYYPAKDRNGAGLVFENTAIGIGASAAANLLQEFLIRKFTPNLPNN
jgi:Carboxypeptidase regulatory-like domain